MTGPPLDPADEALAAALTGTSPGSADPTLSLVDLTQRTGMPVAVLQAIEREGFLSPQVVAGQPRYSTKDAEAIEAGMALLEAGLPLGELLALGRLLDGAMRPVADHAVELFARFVRDPVRVRAASEHEAARLMLDAFERMLPAATIVVAHHVRQLLVTTARKRMERELRGRSGQASG